MRYSINTLEHSKALLNKKSNLENKKRTIHQRRNCSLVHSLSKLLTDYELSIMLLNSKGDLINNLGSAEAYHLIDLAKRLDKLSEEEVKEFNAVAAEVARISSAAMNISDKHSKMFINLLRKYVFVELANHCVCDKKTSIVKTGEFVDYKINRVVKYLGIDVDLKQIPNFIIEYNRNVINVNGNEYYKKEVVKEEKESKINIIVRR